VVEVTGTDEPGPSVEAAEPAGEVEAVGKPAMVEEGMSVVEVPVLRPAARPMRR
jgi:hypothetical protein